MLKIVPFGLCLCLLTASVRADELSAEALIQRETEQDKAKIHEIFQDKIQKISARIALPAEMRNMLISQATEVRQFDLDMLQKKSELKLKHAKQRDELKERLRKEAQNRAQWMMKEEQNFQENKANN